ncbi:sugar phosphate nucleotidyltransferase [Pelagicoccus sp. SDUM812002]|uniref:sugar phosphate nucleotidyltransferase n=1 Tax=Pelagicoccus sp. SDUM812002 TaxID=3041266 RepID=UPI00280CEBAE|nr:sugar phosphate nucleotidyltransferase [Pelagicoccus sp. SDUM812002]MDQ8188072.1 sugar phosphate nucleotidyltransferase [Pelagicoccus sp. SDUM812002]
MKIKKSLITLADPNQRNLPLQTLLDQEGKKRTALELVIKEAVSAGTEEVGLVICPGTQDVYSKAAGVYADRIHFIVQELPTGYAQAILSAKAFIGNEPFLHLVGDHLCVSQNEIGCALQIVNVAEAKGVSVAGVQATRESQLSSFGAIGGRLSGRTTGLYEVERVLEKPSPTEAELKILVPGLRAGFYLCFFGIHALQPSIFSVLEETTRLEGPQERSLSTALDQLCKHEKLLALEVDGSRYDVGADYGLLFAQLALSFAGKDRDRVLSSLVEMLAQK